MKGYFNGAILYLKLSCVEDFCCHFESKLMDTFSHPPTTSYTDLTVIKKTLGKNISVQAIFIEMTNFENTLF